MFTLTKEYAQHLDSENPMLEYRKRFLSPTFGDVYLEGNSLGLLSIDAEQSMANFMEQWKSWGIGGWLNADPDWFTLGERLGAMMAPLVGAEPDEVVATGTTTVNLHALVSTFYRPVATRRKILATSLDFPSDVYALKSQIALRGGDADRDLMLVESNDGRCIDEDDVVRAMTSDVALCVLPSVLYRSGQLLDIERLAAIGRERGIPVGFDCAHSVGAIPHRFDDWNVDFAFWCTYKYLNAGPGSIGALYINRQHFDRVPAMSGWWGYDKDRQFDMSHEWKGARGAGAWQISTVDVLSGSSLLGSLQLFDDIGIQSIREQSLKLTDYLITLLQSLGLMESPYRYRLGTPTEHRRRGGHVAIEHDNGESISRALRNRGIVCDFRPPDVIRMAPVALYISFHDVWRAVQELKAIIDAGEHLDQHEDRGLVT